MAENVVANVQHVAETLLEVGEFVKENMDWGSLWEEVKQSELLYFSVIFLVGKTCLPRLSEGVRKGYLVPFLKVYNLGMVLYSAATFLAMHHALSEVELYTNNCGIAFENKIFDITSKIFYLSKFAEYIDSFGLVMSGKQVSFLQTWHHFGAPWDMWLFYISRHEGLYIFVYLNSFVHTIMYFYYLMTLMKIRFPGKPLITLMQIIQFHLGFYLIWWYKDIECYRSDPRKMFGWLFNYLYVGGVLLLFINFSIWTYMFPKKVAVKPKQN